MAGDERKQGAVPPPPEPVPAGWYPDPDAPKAIQRYWDGEGWTEETAPLPPDGAAAKPEAEPVPSPEEEKDAAGEGRVAGAPPPEWEGGAPAGWYLDPDEAPLRRYWDGSAWTDWTDDTYDQHPDRGENPENDTLVTIGWITAIFFPLIGLIIGIVLGSRGDRRGTQVVIVSIVVILVVGILAAIAASIPKG